MADRVWNIRNAGELPSTMVSCGSENVNPELVESLRKRLSARSRFTVKNPIWLEMNTMKSVIYKHHNQLHKEKFFQGIGMIQRHISRLKEMHLERILSTFVDELPKKAVSHHHGIRFPCYDAVEYVLLRFMGAAKLASQAIGHCKGTFNHVCLQLYHGFFMTFHIVIASELSRFWVLLKDVLYNIMECYEILYPWLDIVRDNSKIHPQTVLPQCLKTWLSVDLDQPPADRKNNDNAKTGVTPNTSSILETIFSSSPQTEKKYFQNVQELDVFMPNPRKLFQDLCPVYSIATDTPQKAFGKRKVEEKEDLSDSCKKLHFDEETVRNTDTKYHSIKGASPSNENKESKVSVWKKVKNVQSLKLSHSTSYGTFRLQTRVKSQRHTCKVKLFQNSLKKHIEKNNVKERKTRKTSVLKKFQTVCQAYGSTRILQKHIHLMKSRNCRSSGHRKESQIAARSKNSKKSILNSFMGRRKASNEDIASLSRSHAADQEEGVKQYSNIRTDFQKENKLSLPSKVAQVTNSTTKRAAKSCVKDYVDNLFNALGV